MRYNNLNKRGVLLNMYRISEIIRGLREDKDLKQADIAKLIGTTQQQYSKYETGDSDLPVRVLIILANFYEVSTDYILGRTYCRESVAGLNKKVIAEYTTGNIISDILSLNSERRAAVIDYISFQKNKK